MCTGFYNSNKLELLFLQECHVLKFRTIRSIKEREDF